MEDTITVGDYVNINDGATSRYGNSERPDARKGRRVTRVRDDVVTLDASNTSSTDTYYARDLTKTEGGVSDEQVAEIQKWATDNGLCSEFDDVMFEKFGWPSRQMFRPTMTMLHDLAQEKGYSTSFERVFPRPVEAGPAWEHPMIPERDKWYRVEMYGGQVHEGRCSRVVNNGHGTDREEWAVYIDGTLIGWVFKTKANAESYSASRSIRSVEEIPRPWRVGDVVPAGTQVGKNWTGEYGGTDTGVRKFASYRPDGASTFDRTIVWMEA